MFHLHRLTSVPGRGLIAVRPDGYIGFRCQTADANQLMAWLTHMDVPLRCQQRQAPFQVPAGTLAESGINPSGRSRDLQTPAE